MKKTALILWAIAALCIISSVPLFVQGDFGPGVVGVVASVILFVVGLRKNKRAAAQPAPKPQAPPPAAEQSTQPAPKPEAPPAEAREITMPNVPGFELKYSYTDVEVAESLHSIADVVPGVYVELEEETPGAGRIVVKLKGAMLGYLPSNKLETMVHDFRARDEAVRARVSSVGPDGMRLALGFYVEIETEFQTLMKSGAEHKVYRLTANSGEEKQENISVCSVGDEVDCEFDADRDKFCAVCGGEVGYFPKAAEALIEDGPRAFVAEVTEDDETGKYKISVALFPQA